MENNDKNNIKNNYEHDGLYAVLEIHQKRNRSIHPPKLIPHCNHGEASLAVLHHATDISKASHRQPVDHTDMDTPNGNQDNDGANEEIEHGSNNNNTDDEDEDEDTEVNIPKQ